MVHFKNNMMDIMVTPNHRMWNKKRHSDHFEFVEAKDVGTRSHFLNRIEGFDGKHKEKITIGKNKYFVKDLCELVGWYISEGSTASEKRENRKKQITTINISQNKLENREKIYTLCRNMFLSGYKTKSSINVYSSEMAEWLRENCGDHSYTKKIPQWIKNLDSSYLKILLGTYLDGDGSWNNEAKYGERFPRAWTSSDQLADDIEEVAFKCGYSVKRGIRTKEAMSKGYVNKQGYEFITRKDQHIIYFSDGRKGKEVILDSRDKDYQNKIISKVAYKGKVYCFTVPTGLFVTKRNNKITIQGNSYSSAQVGIEILIRRLDNWRNILSEWVENHIFLPVAMMQGFIDEEKSEDSDEKEYLYPTIEWNDMQLRDKSNERQSYMQLHDKGVISTQTLLEKFDLDWDKEIQRKREEQVMASATGMVLGPLQGGAGGTGGGMGGLDLGGLGGGGGGGMPPGGDMGAGGAPGGMPPGAAPGGQTGGMGASPAGGSPGGVGTVAAAQQVSPMPNFIGRRGEKRKADEQQEVQPVQTKVIELTKLEQKLLRTLTGMSGKIPYKLFGQYQVKLPNQPQPFVMDFAYPAVGVGVEADGERWHEEIDSKIRDQQRDQKLANVGWRILRFKEEAINNNIDDVARVIYSNVIEAAKDHAQRNKQADSNPEIKKIAEQIKNIETLDKDILKYDRIDIPGDLGYIYLIGI
jgi:very-short-patch-repair endonuclease